MWGCLSPFFYLFVIFSCPARVFFVLGVVGKGSPPSPRNKKIFKKLRVTMKIEGLQYIPIQSTSLILYVNTLLLHEEQ